MADNGSSMIPVTGLWRYEKDGKTYLRGNLNDGCTVLIFPNDRKTEDKHPDYRMYFAKRERPQGDGGGGGGGDGGGGQRHGSRDRDRSGRRRTSDEPPAY